MNKCHTIYFELSYIFVFLSCSHFQHEAIICENYMFNNLLHSELYETGFCRCR